MPIEDDRRQVNFILEIIIHEIKEVCPVYKKDDRIIIDDSKIVLDETDALCIHALSIILNYTMILEHS